MDSSERLTAEKQNVTTHDATSLTAQSGVQEVKGHAMPSTVGLPECLLVCDFVKDMAKEEWKALCQATSDPVSRVEFFKLCRSIVQVVSQSALKVVIPAVVRLLSKIVDDIPASDIMDRPDKCHRESSHRGQISPSSVTYFIDEEDVLKKITFKHGVEVDLVSKRACSRIVSEVAESHASQSSTKRSCSAASVNAILKAKYTISLENIHQSVQEKLKMLEGARPATNLVYLTGVIVKEVTDTVNVKIAKASNVTNAPIEITCCELVQNVTSLLEAHVISETGTILNMGEYELDSALAWTTGKAMIALLCKAERCFDGNKRLKSLSASMKKAIRVLTGNRIPAEDTQRCQTEKPEEGYVCERESDIAEKFSNSEFKANMTDEVSQVFQHLFLELLAANCTWPVMSENPQDYSPASELASTASSAVEMVLEGLQCLVSSTPAQDSLTEGFKVWSTTRDVFSCLQLQLKHLFTKLSSRQRHTKLFAFSKEVVSHVLVCIQSVLASTNDVSFDDEVQIVKDIVISLTESVGRVSNGQQRLDSALSVVSQGGWSNWSEILPEAASLVLPEISTKGSKVVDALQAENMDFNVLPQGESACIPYETVVSAVNSISEKFCLQSEESSTLHCQENVMSVLKRLEKSLSQETIRPSPQLIEEIYQLLLKGRQTVAARKCASASALAALKKGHDAPEGVIAAEILGMFAQESIRSLFLPCFQLPSSWKTSLRPPPKLDAASLSCPGGLSYMARKRQNGASESPSQILPEVLQAAMDVMTKDVMNILSLTLRSSEHIDTFMRTSATPDFEGHNTLGSGCIHDVTKSCENQQDISDYFSLVALLMIRLLTKLQNEEKLSDDMLDKYRAIIDNVLSKLVTAGGVATTDSYPAGINIRKVLKVIYNDLLSEFRSTDRLLKALESMDPSVEVTVARSLITETMTHVTDDEVTKPKITKKRKGFFRFLPSMQKIASCLKKKKSGKQNTENTDGSAAFSTTANHAGAESNTCVVPDTEEPSVSSGSSKRKRSLFTKVISFFKKRASTVSPEQLT